MEKFNWKDSAGFKKQVVGEQLKKKKKKSLILAWGVLGLFGIVWGFFAFTPLSFCCK